MPAPRVLFIGGTGVISSACVRGAVAAGIQVSVLNRGVSTSRPLPEPVEVIRADVRDTDAVRSALSGREFHQCPRAMSTTGPGADRSSPLKGRR